MWFIARNHLNIRCNLFWRIVSGVLKYYSTAIFAQQISFLIYEQCLLFDLPKCNAHLMNIKVSLFDDRATKKFSGMSILLTTVVFIDSRNSRLRRRFPRPPGVLPSATVRKKNWGAFGASNGLTISAMTWGFRICA